MSTKFYRQFAVMGLLAITLLSSAMAVEKASKAKAVLTVNTTTPKIEQWNKTQLANGSLWAWQEAVIASEIGGLRIRELLVDVGSQVKRGQTVARLSQSMVKADIAQKEALVAQAKAELAEATANAKRATDARQSNAFSEQQVTQYLIAQDKAHANLASAEALLESQKIRLRQTNIVAVDDGVISSRSATLGAVVQVGSELFRMVRKDRLEWRAELMAEQLLQVQSGQKVKLKLSNGETVGGAVRMKSPIIDPNTRKALVYVDLPQSETARVGMFARGEIILGQKQVLTVPESALVLRDGYSYLFEVSENHRVLQHKVVTGLRADKRVEVIGGIDGNTVIVAAGGAFLNSGDTVRVSEIDTNQSEKAIQ